MLKKRFPRVEQNRIQNIRSAEQACFFKIKIRGQSQEAGRGSTLSKDLANQLKIPLTDDVEMDASYRLPPVNILHKSEVLSPRLYKQNVAESVIH